MERSFYICSVGEPDKDYVEGNLERIIADSTFYMHEDTTQKGLYSVIKSGDILILKYDSNYIAYGESLGNEIITDNNGWIYTSPVKKWYFFDEKNLKKGVLSYGVQRETLPGSGQMGTVKGITSKFGLIKIKEISNDNELFKSIYYETEKGAMEQIINLLQYKKQIILQGPPGTGKTREAKLISREMIPLTPELIKRKLSIGKLIPTAKGQVSYKVLSITDDKVILKREKGTTNDTSISRITTAYQEQRWKNEVTNNDDRMAVAIAKFLYDDFFKENEQFNLIQFHPSYTYEDFVRGIVAKPNPDGIGILYEAENKTLGEFANRALDNYLDSQKEEVDVSDNFTAFVNYIIEQIGENEKYMISDNIYIYLVDDKRFKYKGDNWTAHPDGLNMNFSELRKIIDLGLNFRQEITKSEELNALTRQHATYYQNFIELFRQFIVKDGLDKKKKVEVKPYVLIIDEINRANLSSVLGELIYALEYRGEAVDSIYKIEGKKELILPPNLYIIGTMNTADRSVGHIDYAIRRRFAFVDVLPEKLSDTDEIYFNTAGYEAVEKLFVSDFISNEFDIKDVQIGHSYFIAKKDEATDEAKREFIFKMKMDYEIKPILREYLKDGILLADKKVGDISIKDYIESL